MKNMADQIDRFVTQQTSLLEALERQLGKPLSKTVELVPTGPKSGTVRLATQSWKFVRHGRGYRFSSDEGVVVDAHRRVELRDAVDAWRLSQFIDSLEGKDEETSERAVEAVLSDFAKSGALEYTDLVGLYRLCREDEVNASCTA